MGCGFLITSIIQAIKIIIKVRRLMAFSVVIGGILILLNLSSLFPRRISMQSHDLPSPH